MRSRDWTSAFDVSNRYDFFEFSKPVAAESDDTLSDDASTSGSIGAYGGTLSSAIDFAGDVDWIRLNPERGKSYTISVQGPEGLVYSIVNALGDVVASGSGVLTLQTQTNSAYYLAVQSSPDHPDLTGSYDVTVTRRADDLPSDASTTASISPGETLRVNVDGQYDQDWIRVTAGPEGGVYRIDIDADAGSFDPRFYLLDADENSLIPEGFYRPVSYYGYYYPEDWGAGFELGPNEVAYIDIRLMASDYNLTLTEIFDDVGNSRDDAVEVSVDAGAAYYAIDYETDVDSFIFHATVSGPIALLTHNRSVPETLVDETGATIEPVRAYREISALDSFTDYENYRIYFVEAGHTYQFDISGNGHSSSVTDYSFELVTLPDEQNSDFISATPLAFGDSGFGFLDNPDDVDYYIFDVAAPDVFDIILYITPPGGTDNSGVNAIQNGVLNLYDVNFNLIASVDQPADLHPNFNYWGFRDIFISTAGPVYLSFSSTADNVADAWGGYRLSLWHSEFSNDAVSFGTQLDDTFGTDAFVVHGLEGNDVISVYGGPDNTQTVYGGAGHDQILGGAPHAFLYGGEGDDYLQADVFGDTLVGGNGNDYLANYAGETKMVGGSGRDTFGFKYLAWSEVYQTTISDFNVLEDRIQFFWDPLSYENLSIVQTDEGALIKLPNGSSILLSGVYTEGLPRGAFVFSNPGNTSGAEPLLPEDASAQTLDFDSGEDLPAYMGWDDFSFPDVWYFEIA